MSQNPVDGETSNGAAVVPIPDGWRLTPSADLKTRANGRVLIGGAPLKIIRLSERGAELARGWFAGETISPATTHQRLARRLLRAGMAHPLPCPAKMDEGQPRSTDPEIATLTVIIPVKDDPIGLHNTITGLFPLDVGSTTGETTTAGPQDLDIQVVVVDDGSAEPVTVDHPTVQVLRSERATGPGPARQRGLNKAKTKLVAFIDAGVVLSAEDLKSLAAAMTDQSLVAAAPRVLSSAENHLVGRYDSRRSPLDLGPGESLVGPGRIVPYVPTACLVARSAAVAEVGGFDPGLRYGEDVDLVWRLGRSGDIRYLPNVSVTHPPRQTITKLIKQRHGYGSAAAPLAARHGAAVAPCSLSPWSALVTGLFVSGHPVIGLSAAAGTGFALRPKIQPLPDLTIEALQLTLRGHWYGGLSALTALARTWSPLAIAVAMVMPSKRSRIVGLLAAGFARRILDGPRAPMNAATDLAVGAVDDLAYASGVLAGSFRARSVRALLPNLTSWPKPPDRQ